MYFFKVSSAPLDTLVNRLCGLWASLEKLVSQSNGSLLAEGQGHISMEAASEDLAQHSPLCPTPLKETLYVHLAIHFEKHTEILVQSSEGTLQK